MPRKTTSLRELADLVDGSVAGNAGFLVHGLNALDQAGPDEISFIADCRAMGRLAESRAGACLVPQGAEEFDRPVIRIAHPVLAAARIHQHFLEEPFLAEGIHPSAVLGEGAEIPAEVSIGPLVAVGRGARLGRRVRLEAGVVLDDGVVLGDDVVLHANVSVAKNCRIGSRVAIHSGTVIGSDGYGYATTAEGLHVKRPQVGIVIIEDDVEIGANVCVDRATFGATRIGRGSKIDNLVQIAHNVEIGEHCLVIAQAGIAGSTILGRNVVLAGKTAVAGHLRLGDRVMTAAMSGVHNNQPDGAVIGGAPAFEARQWGRATTVFAKLPDMHRELRRLRRELNELKQQQDKERGDEGD